MAATVGKLGFVFPFTVTLMYLASVEGMVYFSEFNVVPLLSPLNLLVNVVPSVDVAITKWYCSIFPNAHAMSTLQMFLVDPRSARIQEPIPVFDHLVFKLLSSTFAGGYEEELELAVTPLMGRLVPHELGG